MPYPAHSRLTIIGKWATDLNEVVNLTLSLVDATSGSGWVPNQSAFLAAIKPAVAAWWSAADTRIPSTCNLVTLKIAEIAADGSYAAPASVLDVVPSQPGAYAQPSSPGIISFAQTFITSKMRPPGRYGRFYPPNCGIQFAAGADPFQCTVPQAQNMAAQTGTLLKAMVTAGGQPVVASKVGAGSALPIVSVSVDSVVDVQRRRKNKITGTRSFASTYP